MFYEVQWDQGPENSWVPLNANSSEKIFSFNATSPVPFPSGALIKFRARAKNGVGFGLYSEELLVIADQVP